mmetsp:Transcript_9422/g.20382  ORF Transcript_9422/g.20382 Transcript_9422/m.20382 type:complete len:553 (+) Transcript_9422:97-1755(+)
MKPLNVVSLAVCLPLGGVNSFQIPPPPTASIAKHSYGAAAATGIAKPRSLVSPLFSTDTATADKEAELKEIEQQVKEVTEALEKAKKRQAEAQENADAVREERAAVVSETETEIARLKRVLGEEMTDLSDRIEGAQDDLRKTESKTKSDIFNIQEEAKERQESLKSEISELESRLESLRGEVANAVRERDQTKNSVRKEKRDLQSVQRKELEELKREASKEKKELTREKWALENRIQQASLDVMPAQAELEEEKKKQDTSKISALKDALLAMKNKMLPQVDELKEKKSANEMFFDQSVISLKKEKEVELDFAKSVYEGEIESEEKELLNATGFYEAELEAKEKELQRTIELSNQPVEPAGVGAIERARKAVIDIFQEKFEAVSSQEAEKVEAVNNVIQTQKSVQDRFDAELENAQRSLKSQESREKRQLEKEDKKRERRKDQLRREMDELTTKLSTLMQQERSVAEGEYANLQAKKTKELSDSVAQSKAASNDIQTMKSNLVYVQYELNQLEKTAEQKEEVLSELVGERTSFRKQLRRTAKVAFSRITRRGS